jgi:alpha-1,3-rhamnosyltransferase
MVIAKQKSMTFTCKYGSIATWMSTGGPQAGKKQSDVFVCVPSYNHAAYLEQCLRSIIAQTSQPRKLLVIDDGSRDDSVKIAERILKDCPFDTEMIARENRGLCRTLNEAFAISQGKYFAYLGSDDLWLPEFLEARAELLDRRENAVLAYGHAYLIDDAGNAFDATTNYTDTWANYPDGDAREMILNGGAPISSTVVYRRSALENVEWNSDARLEDYEMYLRLMTRGEFAFDPRTMSAWRRHEANTSADRLMMLDELLAAHERNFQSLGTRREEMTIVQQRIKFLYAQMELQHGNKSGALRLAAESWRGTSIGQLFKFYLRMLVPMSLIERRRRSRRQMNVKEFRV